MIASRELAGMPLYVKLQLVEGLHSHEGSACLDFETRGSYGEIQNGN